jgi:cellulose synthase/poly-beta-1,6-N-acetylglucosamine synthase-like glycosyltransferase
MISVVIINKDEMGIDDTLSDVSSEIDASTEPCEIVVVDASSGRLDCIRRRHEAVVRWLDFKQPPGVRVTIPHQRNVGVREAHGDIIVFTDAGCRPRPGWLASLIDPFSKGEDVVAGAHVDASNGGRFEGGNEIRPEKVGDATYVGECGTLNVAFRRRVFDEVEGFDENLAYGSDVDFCWRLIDLGYRIRYIADAIIENDWGTPRRQRRRAYMYGKARARLCRKHRSRKSILRNNLSVIINPLLLLGMPITMIFPPYSLLLLVPAHRVGCRGVRGLARGALDQLWFGAGVLVELMAERVYVRQRSVPSTAESQAPSNPHRLDRRSQPPLPPSLPS